MVNSLTKGVYSVFINGLMITRLYVKRFDDGSYDGRERDISTGKYLSVESPHRRYHRLNTTDAIPEKETLFTAKLGTSDN